MENNLSLDETEQMWHMRLDMVYNERNQLVSFLSRQFDSYLYLHEDMEPGFQNLVVINGPTGQMTWHIPDCDLDLFNHLVYRTDYVYDGHSTEEKYNRLKKIS